MVSSRPRHALAVLLPLLLLGYGVLHHAQLALGAGIWLSQGAITLLVLLLVSVALFIGHRTARLPLWPGAALLIGMIVLAVVILAQGLLGGTGGQFGGTGGVISAAITATLPLAVLLVSLSAYVASPAPGRARLLVLSLIGLLALGIAQAALRDPLVWVGGATEAGWRPIIWRGEWLGYGNEYTVRGFSLLDSPVQYGLVAAAVACMAAAWTALRRRTRLWSAPLLVLGLVAAYASANRTVLFGLAAGAAMMFIARRWPRANLAWIVLVPLIATLILTFGSGVVTWAVDQNLVTYGYVRTLLIRLDDFPVLASRVLGGTEQVLIGTVDWQNLTRIAGARPDGAESLPIDNELYYLTARYGLAGPVLMLIIWTTLLIWAQAEWRRWRQPAMLAVIGLLGVWAIGQSVNVLHMYALPVLALMIAYARPAR